MMNLASFSYVPKDSNTYTHIYRYIDVHKFEVMALEY